MIRLINCMCSIKNAYMSQKDQIIVKNGKMIIPVLKKLSELNYIKFFKVLISLDIKIFLDTKYKRIETLKFFNTGMGFVSYKKNQVVKSQRGLGSIFLTTSRGIKTAREAITLDIGGLPLFYIN